VGRGDLLIGSWKPRRTGGSATWVLGLGRGKNQAQRRAVGGDAAGGAQPTGTIDGAPRASGSS
jgi:hypothetical protein